MAEDDAPTPDELSPHGGEWSGHLFENPHTGFPESLIWGFTFELGEVSRESGTVHVNVQVEWVPLPGAEWRAMAGRSARCQTFGEPIESSAYFFEHYCYDAAERLGAHLDISGLTPTAENRLVKFR